MLMQAGYVGEDKSRDTTDRKSVGYDAEAHSHIPNFGVALFDNPNDMTAGWACRADESPFKFSGIAELSNDTLWVTNLSFDEYKNRAKKISHLRRSDYLRSSLTSIAADLGIRITGVFAREASVVLARVFRHSMLIAIHTYAWESPLTDLRGDTLSDDIRRYLPYATSAQPLTRAAFISAHQSYSMPEWGSFYEPDTVPLTMRYNRMDYAKQIMATMVPDDSWTYMPPGDACRMTINDLLNPDRPCMVEAAVELGTLNPDIAALISFGAQTARRSGIRKWISQPELSWLSRHATVRVSSVLYAQAAAPMPANLGLPERLTADPLFAMSLSAGLVAEAHWSAVAAPVYNRTSKSNDVSSRAVWLRAVDRALSFGLAQKAYEAGFRVSGYGNGSVFVRVARSRLHDCLKFADENNIAHPAFDAIFKENGTQQEFDHG